MSDKLKASMTLEASMVVSLVLFAIVEVMKQDIRLHDSVTTAATANETLELYGHMGEKDEAAAVSYGTERLGRLFSGEEYSISLEGYEHSGVVELSSAESSRSLEEDAFEPEYYMRMMTLLDGVLPGD